MNARTSLNVLLSVILLAVTTAAQALAENTATNPIPPDGANVPAEVFEESLYLLLDFTPGLGAVSHTGYFSDAYSDVAGRDPAHCLGSPPFPEIFPTGYLVGWDTPEIPEFARASLEQARTYYWCVDEFDGQTTWPGNVWTFTVMPKKAWNPNPPDGATNVVPDPNVTLTWERGDIETAGYHISYEIYYGTDRDAVRTATTPNADIAAQSYEISGLAPATDYFWRVDTIQRDVTSPFPIIVTTGDIWTFRTGGPRTITVGFDPLTDFFPIQAAIDAAENGDYIVVDDGTYVGPGNIDIDFKGKAITVRSKNGPRHCTIDCRKSGRGFLFNRGRDSNSVLYGFEITDGAKDEGGAIYCTYSSPRIVNCRIIKNLAFNTGGGVYCGSESNPVFIGCEFYWNTANLGGAVSCARGGNATFNSCIFFGNSAEEYGGGLYVHVSSITLLNCTVTGNHATYLAGGLMSAVDAEVIVRNSIFWNDTSDNGNQEIACAHRVNLYVDYSTVQGGLSAIFNNASRVNWGIGNKTSNPYFKTNTCLLSSSSTCINAGDPAFSTALDDIDVQGEKRVMLGRIDIGADEFNPFLAEFVIVRKTRVDRTIFEYEGQVVLENTSRFTVSDISFEMVKCSKNMTVSDPNVAFEDTQVGWGESITSIDTCTFTVDRSEPIDQAEIIWHVTAELVAGGAKMEYTVSTALPPDPQTDFDGLKDLAEKWLWQGSAGGIDADTVPDGTVNLADFAKFADQWIKQ